MSVTNLDRLNDWPRFCPWDEERGESCCALTHDNYLKELYEDKSNWPAACAGGQYPGSKELACLSCNPDQPKWTYIDEEKDVKIIRVCRSLLFHFYTRTRYEEKYFT